MPNRAVPNWARAGPGRAGPPVWPPIHARAGLEGVVIHRLALYERLDILLQKKTNVLIYYILAIELMIRRLVVCEPKLCTALIACEFNLFVRTS